MIVPFAAVMNPEPKPDPMRSPDRRPPNIHSNPNGSTGTRSMTSVCTVTTAGATRATASVIAFRREAETDGEGLGETGTVCAIESAGLAPWHPTSSAASKLAASAEVSVMS
jgi:hypothetical protein